MFTHGIEKFPNEARLYRFRGHRYLSLRRFNDAVADLERAVVLDSTNYDIAYHLALAYYLTRRYDDAVAAIDKCVAFADEPEVAGRGGGAHQSHLVPQLYVAQDR